MCVLVEQQVADIEKILGREIGKEEVLEVIKRITNDMVVVKLRSKWNYLNFDVHFSFLDGGEDERFDEFKRKHLQISDKVSLLDDATRSIFTRSQNNVRAKVRALAIETPWGSFVPRDRLEDLVDTYDEHKVSFDGATKRIARDFDQIQREFMEKIRDNLRDIDPSSFERNYNRIARQMNEKRDAFLNSTKFELDVYPAPYLYGEDGNESQIQRLVEEKTFDHAKQMASSIMSSMLNKLFRSAQIGLASVDKNDKLMPSVIQSIEKSIEGVRKDNLLGNEQIERFAQELDVLWRKRNDQFALEEGLESLLVEVYVYAAELGVSLGWEKRFSYSREDIEDLVNEACLEVA